MPGERVRNVDPPIAILFPVPWNGVDTGDNGHCTECGRDCHEVTQKELGDWIVDIRGVLICSACSAAHPGILSAERQTRRAAVAQ